MKIQSEHLAKQSEHLAKIEQLWNEKLELKVNVTNLENEMVNKFKYLNIEN